MKTDSAVVYTSPFDMHVYVIPDESRPNTLIKFPIAPMEGWTIDTD